MPFRLACLLVLVTAAVFAIGCDDEGGHPPPPPAISGYAIPNAPESLIVNLQHSYRRREIEEYAKLLAPEFRFYFQPVDQVQIGKEFWTHDEDSVGTQALLETPLVAEIRIELLYSGRDSTIDMTPPADSVRVRIIATDLQVDQTDGITWVVSDQQDMFFRKGLPANGEDPLHWFMYEWHDLPSISSARATSPVTWGGLKNRYGN